jgi:hypothetical protein
MKQRAERSGIAECTGQELPPPAEFSLEHDPEKWKPVFPRDKWRRHLRGDHAQTSRSMI